MVFANKQAMVAPERALAGRDEPIIPTEPHAVLGMGGYVTVPGGLAAALVRAPLLLMNSDASLLLSNRALKPFAERLLFGLPGRLDDVGAKAVWTGSPVRSAIADLPPPAERFAGRGSQLHFEFRLCRHLLKLL